MSGYTSPQQFSLPDTNELQLRPSEAPDQTSLIPESSRYDPWYQKALDLEFLPRARRT